MARLSLNADSIDLSTTHKSKLEIENRRVLEQKLKGSDNIKPAESLDKLQKKCFKQIVTTLQEMDLIGSSDMYIVTETAKVRALLMLLDQQIATNSLDYNLLRLRDKYSTAYVKLLRELSLTAQARASYANSKAKNIADAQDPVMQLISGKVSNN